jgi:hypothetical protein
MRYEGEAFHDCRVELDGNQFDSCRFNNVTFHYSGGPIHLCGCEFDGFGWTFGGDLARGLAVLGQLYASNQAVAVSQLSKAMFPPRRQAATAKPMHPSLAAILQSAEHDGG